MRYTRWHDKKIMEEPDNPNPRKDYIGHRCNRLVVEKELPRKNNKRMFICKCDCGGSRVVMQANIKRTYSCGCIRAEKKHKHYANRKINQFIRRTSPLGKSEFIWVFENMPSGMTAGGQDGSIIKGLRREFKKLTMQK